MRLSRCQRVLTPVVLAALALCVTASAGVAAKPSKPGKPGGFRLFSSALNIFQANRVQCYVVSDGTICYTGSSTVPGGAWPRGTANSYVFGSGINIAGVVEPGDKAVNGFAGDTAGAFFNNTAGGNNGLPVRPIFDSNDPEDAADWPEEARVPLGDATADLFDPTLQGQLAASQGDLWFVAWEGDPGNVASRTHPLGVLVETRAMAWNFPAGNEDINYFIYTFYNITSLNPDAYLGARPSIRPLLLEQAQRFHALNTAKFGITLPEEGYTINDMYAAFTADMDVGNANNNFAGVNVPFALGYTYDAGFNQAAAASIGWTFDPAIFGLAPFFPGPGFVGVKYLGSPTDPETGAPVGLTLFGTFSRSSGSLQDPSDDKQLYRYITGGLTATDGACSLPNPLEAKICFVNISSPADMRFFQSSGPIDLPAGGFGSITVAYVYAAPVASGACPGAACLVAPADNNADLTILGDPARMASGVNTIDTMMGYLGNTNGNATDTNTAVVTQEEFITVPGSLLGKARVAQSVFDNKFLLPFAPDRPEFFLVPGNAQVTVLWTRSPTETNGDPFFAVASSPTTEGSPNPLYDPNFRQRDVEGYRIYRGRTDSPSELTLLAQFDYAPDAEGRGLFTDFRGIVNPIPQCAPELTVTAGCAIPFSTPAPGEPYVGSVDIDLVGTITQLTPGNRVLLASGEAQVLPGVVDTAFKDITAGRLASGASTLLANTGVPFVYVDRGVRNSLRYFYTVTAFDVNSLVSGPSSLESARLSKAVTPTAAASNAPNEAQVSTGIFGRDVELPSGGALPTIDPERGTFSGPFPPANGGEVALGALVAEVVGDEGAAVARLDSIQLGSSYQGVPHLYWFTGGPPGLAAGTTVFSVSMLLPEEVGVTTATGNFAAQPVDAERAAVFGGNSSFVLPGEITLSMPGTDYLTLPGRGCVNARPGFTGGALGDALSCAYNGSRWFAGPSPENNETQDDPIACNTQNFSGTPMPCFNNAGALPGVTTIHQTQCYQSAGGADCRPLTGILSGAKRAADFNIVWGAGGAIAQVIDVTHNVEVPFNAVAGGTWGILNQSTAAAGSPDGSATLTNMDFACVEPFRTYAAGGFVCPAATPAYALSSTAVPGTVGFFSGGAYPPTVPVVPAANAGFALYISGEMYTFELEGGALPAEGAVWSLRQYVGAIVGGQGAAGDLGPYQFSNPEEVLPFTAVGAELRSSFTVDHTVAASSKEDLNQVHTVPDPYYVMSAFEASTEQKVLKFVGLPQRAIVRIYSASGVLVRLLEHDGAAYSPTSLSQGSELAWDLRNRNNQVVASGVYFYHVEAGDARRVGRFTVVNFAQ
jgi:hypothetical protein